MFDKLRARFVDEAHCWYKMWSSWLAIVWGLIVTAFWTDPSMVASIVSGLPDEVRALLSPVVLGLVSALPIVVRLIKQRPKTPAPAPVDATE